MHARFALQVNPGRSLVVGSVRVSMGYVTLPQLCRLIQASIRRRSAAVAAAAAAAVGGRGGRKVSIQPTSHSSVFGGGAGVGAGSGVVGGPGACPHAQHDYVCVVNGSMNGSTNGSMNGSIEN